MAGKDKRINMRIMNRQKNILASILGVILVALIVFLSIRFKNLNSNKLQSSPVIGTQRQSIPTNSFPQPDYSGWKNYSNSKFGFTIQYPKNLSLKAVEFDIKSLWVKYQRDCTSGVVDGCGGSRWPDFVLLFMKTNGKTAFMIQIFQLPMNKVMEGGVEHEKFTFYVTTPFNYYGDQIKSDPVSDIEISEIFRSLSFSNPDKPLQCLWSIETGKGPEENDPIVIQNKKTMSLLSGSYYDSKSNKCYETKYYTWHGQEDTDAPPFKNVIECVSGCVR